MEHYVGVISAHHVVLNPFWSNPYGLPNVQHSYGLFRRCSRNSRSCRPHLLRKFPCQMAYEAPVFNLAGVSLCPDFPRPSVRFAFIFRHSLADIQSIRLFVTKALDVFSDRPENL